MLWGHTTSTSGQQIFSPSVWPLAPLSCHLISAPLSPLEHVERFLFTPVPTVSACSQLVIGLSPFVLDVEDHMSTASKRLLLYCCLQVLGHSYIMICFDRCWMKHAMFWCNFSLKLVGCLLVYDNFDIADIHLWFLHMLWFHVARGTCQWLMIGAITGPTLHLMETFPIGRLGASKSVHKMIPCFHFLAFECSSMCVCESL